jgi:hypothetical protein
LAFGIWRSQHAQAIRTGITSLGKMSLVDRR